MIKNKLVLTQNSAINEAVRLLDENGNGVLPVVDDANKLVGIITDGDIRRAILNEALDINHIINTNPKSLHFQTPKKQIINYLKSIRRRHLPLVDDDGCYVDIFVLDDVSFYNKPNKVVIMAGGLGSRLGELTKDIPKPMLKISGKPILEHIINNFAHYGFCDIYISVNYKADVIKDYFGDGSGFGVNIKYLTEDKRLGTAGALSLIESEIDTPLIVCNGDVLSTLNFENMLEFHKEKKPAATICTRKVTEQIAFGVLDICEDKILSIKEKPVNTYFISAGIYVLEPKVLHLLPKNEYYDITTLFEMLINNKEVLVSYEIDDYWVDIGRKDDYIAALKEYVYP